MKAFCMANHKAEDTQALQQKGSRVHFSTVGRIPIYFLNNPNSKIPYHTLRTGDGGESGESP